MSACACRKRYAPNELHTTRGVLGPESRLEIAGDQVNLVLKGEKLEVVPGFAAGKIEPAVQQPLTEPSVDLSARAGQVVDGARAHRVI